MLPPELWYNILSKLSFKEQLRIQTVSSTFLEISKQLFKSFIHSIYNWSFTAPYAGVFRAYSRNPMPLSRLRHTNTELDDGIMKVEAYYQEHINFKRCIQKLPSKYLWKLLEELTSSAADIISDANEDTELRFLMATSIILNCNINPELWLQKFSTQYHYLCWWYQTYSLDEVAGLCIVSPEAELDIAQFKVQDSLYQEIFN